VDQHTPGDDLDPASAALAALFDAHRSIADALDSEIRVACGLSPAEVDVLDTLTRGPNGRQRMVDIADHMCLSKSGVTQIVDRLEAAGLVARESSPTDRRLVYAAITIAGHDALDKATPVVTAIAHEHIGSRLRDTELAKLTRVLRTIAAANTPEIRQR
jgi:DNA-binding MarR family transcriptional regulator